jgi:NAD(P)-dependent dehydrogenase (short-subunit alcohol dehydrogenase family)
LGASSGFGAATLKAVAKRGMNIFGVHMDRKAMMPQVEALIEELKAEDIEVHFFNINAADPTRRAEVLDEMCEIMGEGEGIRVLMHSLAFGALKPFVEGEDPNNWINSSQMDMTCDVMGHSLIYWTQDLIARKMFERDGRIFAMTSSGSTRIWSSYGAVSAAKATLESHIRQLAVELAPMGITANSIRAGVTDTPALRKIPGNDNMLRIAGERNPGGRLTTAEDVADVIALLCEPGTRWMTGNVIGVDGGEDIVA